MWIAWSRFIDRRIYPVMVCFLPIVPKIAIAAVIIWFGFGFAPKLLLVFLLSFFPIVVSSITGFERGPRRDGLRAPPAPAASSCS